MRRQANAAEPLETSQSSGAISHPVLWAFLAAEVGPWSAHRRPFFTSDGVESIFASS